MNMVLPSERTNPPRAISRRGLFSLDSPRDGVVTPESDAGFWLRVQHRAMACRFEITLSGEDSIFLETARDALGEVDRVEARLTVFRDASDLVDLNRGSESWKDDHNAWKTGGGGIWQTGSYDPASKLYIVGTGNPYPIYDPQFRPGDNLYTDSVIAVNVDTGKLAWHFQYTPNDSWDFDEVGVHMLYDTTIDGEKRKVVGHYGRNGFFYSLDRTNGKFIKSEKYVNDLNWTKGIDQRTGKPFEYSPKLDVQIYNPDARALRGEGMKRTCPTWHGGVAHQPLAFNPVKGIAYGVGTEGCFTQNGAAVASRSKDGGIDPKASQPRKYSSDLYYGAVTAFDAVNHKVLAKAVTDIEIRSGVTATAGGLVFTALQDGWIVAYNDETLEELWRFNLGTPLKGSPVTYAIGPRQYLAVQTSGRHLHPVKFDNLQNSSYLFVFALN